MSGTGEQLNQMHAAACSATAKINFMIQRQSLSKSQLEIALDELEGVTAQGRGLLKSLFEREERP